jgi:hypothetical protein
MTATNSGGNPWYEGTGAVIGCVREQTREDGTALFRLGQGSIGVLAHDRTVDGWCGVGTGAAT